MTCKQLLPKGKEMSVITDTIRSPLFDAVPDYLEDALIIAWDGCHKIYLGMDEEQAEWFRENYASTDESTSQTFEGTPEEMLLTIAGWWNESCPLRFINAVHTDNEDPNRGFVTVIEQFADEEEDDEDDYWDNQDDDEDE